MCVHRRQSKENISWTSLTSDAFHSSDPEIRWRVQIWNMLHWIESSEDYIETNHVGRERKRRDWGQKNTNIQERQCWWTAGMFSDHDRFRISSLVYSKLVRGELWRCWTWENSPYSDQGRPMRPLGENHRFESLGQDWDPWARGLELHPCSTLNLIFRKKKALWRNRHPSRMSNHAL